MIVFPAMLWMLAFGGNLMTGRFISDASPA
jgi:hypothetical protein